MRKINYIFKILLEFLLLFFIFFVWVKFVTKKTVLSFVISSIIASVIEGIITVFRCKKSDKYSLKEKEKLEAEKMFVSLTNNGNQTLFLINLFKSRHKNVKNEKGLILLTKGEDNVAILPIFKYENLTCDDINSAYQKAKKFSPSKIIILCNNYTADKTSFVKTFPTDIKLLDKYQTYAHIYKEYDFYPQYSKEIKTTPTFKSVFTSIFNHSHAKGFIISALFLLIGSFFTKLNLYYIISTSILASFGLICLFNKKEKSTDFSL